MPPKYIFSVTVAKTSSSVGVTQALPNATFFERQSDDLRLIYANPAGRSKERSGYARDQTLSVIPKWTRRDHSSNTLVVPTKSGDEASSWRLVDIPLR